MLKIIIDENNNVILSGRFDASQEDKAKGVFDRVQESCSVDFKNLDYISSVGLGILLSVQKRLNQAGHEIKLINMNDHIRDVFQYAGFNYIFKIE
jgi:anti-sigma B factor antagonist